MVRINIGRVRILIIFFLIFILFTKPSNSIEAFYNSTLGAPMCNTSISPCVAPSSLLKSRNSLGTPEPNYPNTIDSCNDGTSGNYQSDESSENITIQTLNGTTFSPLDIVNVTICVYAWSDGASDNLNLVYTLSLIHI
mgnify:CR=1 FL=1